VIVGKGVDSGVVSCNMDSEADNEAVGRENIFGKDKGNIVVKGVVSNGQVKINEDVVDIDEMAANGQKNLAKAEKEIVSGGMEIVSGEKIAAGGQDKFDSVVLGCTHYVFWKEAIKAKFNCRVFDGISGTVDHLTKILGITDHQPSTTPQVEFLGGLPDKNSQIYENILFKVV
jgi:glutamate racemase